MQRPNLSAPAYWLVLAWLLGMAMALLGLRDTFDPARQQYGANFPGDLALAFGFVTVLSIVLWFVIRPSSYRASWGRAVVAAVVLTVTRTSWIRA